MDIICTHSIQPSGISMEDFEPCAKEWHPSPSSNHEGISLGRTVFHPSSGVPASCKISAKEH